MTHHRPLSLLFAGIISLVLLSTSTLFSAPLSSPRAKKRPHKMTIHGESRIDPWFWLKNRENREVLGYLNRENRYFERWFKALVPLRDKIFHQLKSQINAVEQSVPVRQGDFFYYYRYQQGSEYRIYCRRKVRGSEAEEVLLNVNKMAKPGEFLEVTSFKVSPDHRYAAYAVDTLGRRLYKLHVKDLTTGAVRVHPAPQVVPEIEWGEDSATLYFVTSHPETLRFEKIYRTRLGDPFGPDELLWFEEDETFSLSLRKSASKQIIFLESESTLTSEIKYLDSHNSLAAPILFAARSRGLEYSVEDGGDCFFIRNNADGAKEFKLSHSPKFPTPPAQWQTLFPEVKGTFLEDFAVFESFLVLEEKSGGENKIKVVSRQDGTKHYVALKEAAGVIRATDWQDYSSPWFRFVYESLTTPPSTYEEHWANSRRVLLKQDFVGGGFQSANYLTERRWFKGHDGVDIPLTLVRRKDLDPGKPAPLLLYGYGSYGETIEPWFDRSILSLVDRGFIYAIAHVRGGQMMGRQWYESGRQLQKKNTFYDFIACAEGLIQMGLTSKDHLYAMGGSAGGLLMGAVLNMRPDLFNGVIATVPFVDVVTTMLDESIPLTTSEFDEWGNPKEAIFYHYMLSYSPYDQVKKQCYPNLLVTAGLHDSQVQYWEPAKWVAKLRDMKVGDSLLFLVTNTQAGHGGASGRYEALLETARDFAFLWGLEGGGN